MTSLAHGPWALIPPPSGTLAELRRQVALSVAVHRVGGDAYFYRGDDSRALGIRLVTRVLDALASDVNGGHRWTVDELRDALRAALAAGGEVL